MQNVAVRLRQPPLANPRSITSTEQATIDLGQQQWFSEINPSLATPSWRLLVNPKKRTTLQAAGGAAIAFTGFMATVLAKQWHAPESVVKLLTRFMHGTTATGGIIAGSAPLTYFNARQRNGNIIETWKRQPVERPTLRDLLVDPIFSVDTAQTLRPARQAAEILFPRSKSIS